MIVHQDVLALLEVDIPDTLESRAKVRSYARDVLIRRFRQDAICLKFVHAVETILMTDEEIR